MNDAYFGVLAGMGEDLDGLLAGRLGCYHTTKGRPGMTKRDLVVRIAEETGLIQQDVYNVIQKTLDYIVESLNKGETVEFRNFGVFEVRERKPRIGRNPNRPEQVVTIPSRKVVKFKPGKIMKDVVTGAS